MAGVTVLDARALTAHLDERDAYHARAALEDLGVDPVAGAHDAAGELAAPRADTELRTPDCCVLYAAAIAGAETVVAFDRRLARAAELRGLRTP